MKIDLGRLQALRDGHPAWRLLRADNAVFVIGFLHRVFIESNRRSIGQANITEALEDEIYIATERYGEDFVGKNVQAYLNDWASQEKRWLRKYYAPGNDEPQFDLTSGAEKAIAWVLSLEERNFVGTGSRLMTLVEILRQINAGAETDQAERLKSLRKKRGEIDAEITRVMAGHIDPLDDTEVKERFQQFTQLGRDLLFDFREVEEHFRSLDRTSREKIAIFDGSKGALLEEILSERESIADSDQGRSFQSFWDILMSGNQQEELTTMLKRILDLPAIQQMNPDMRLRRIHHDWLEAGETTQRMVARLSHQLRRFLDDKAWLENRRIIELLHDIEKRAIEVRENPPEGDFMTMEGFSVEVELPMERPLYTPNVKLALSDEAIAAGEGDIDLSALFNLSEVDKAELIDHVREGLRGTSQITLHQLIKMFPVKQGLAEVVTYLHLKDPSFISVVDEDVDDPVSWDAVDASGQPVMRVLHAPRVSFIR